MRSFKTQTKINVQTMYSQLLKKMKVQNIKYFSYMDFIIGNVLFDKRCNSSKSF